MPDLRSHGQKLAMTALLIGGTSFFYFGAEILARHTSWTDFQTPAGVGEVFGMLASTLAAVTGALGLNTTVIGRLFDLPFSQGQLPPKKSDHPQEPPAA